MALSRGNGAARQRRERKVGTSKIDRETKQLADGMPQHSIRLPQGASWVFVDYISGSLYYQVPIASAPAPRPQAPPLNRYCSVVQDESEYWMR